MNAHSILKSARFLAAAALLALLSSLSAQAAVQVVDLGATTHWRLAENRRNQGGVSAAAAGDVNGDGWPDLVLSAPTAPDLSVVNTGIVYVRFGGPYSRNTGFDDLFFDLTPSPLLTTNPLLSSALFADGTGLDPAGVQFRAPETGMRFGYSIAVGDFDGDSIDDIAIGAPGPATPSDRGVIYVIRGRAELGGLVDVTDEIAGGRAFSLIGNQVGDGCGLRLAMGDLNNDGRDDLVVPLPSFGMGGEIYIVGGRSFSLISQDTLSTVPAPRVRIASSITGESFGDPTVLGDLDGDGRLDLLAAAPRYETSPTQRGRIAGLRFPSGFTTSSIFVGTTLPDGLLVELPGDGSLRGVTMAVGRLDVDSIPDLAVGFPGAPIATEPTQVGQVYVTGSPWTQRDSQGRAQLWNNLRFYGEGEERLQRFGATVAFAHFFPDMTDSLIIGAPGTTFESRASAGAVFITVDQTGGNLRGDPDDDWGIVLGGRQADEGLGSALAIVDFNADGSLDFFAAAAAAAPFDPACNTTSYDTWFACHAAGQGARIFGFPNQGDVLSPPLSASSTWLMLE